MQLHNPRDEIKNWNKVFNILQKYKKKGYIKSIGISLARNHYFSKKIMNKFDFIQDEFNLLRVADQQRYPAFFDYQGVKYLIKIEKAKSE